MLLRYLCDRGDATCIYTTTFLLKHMITTVAIAGKSRKRYWAPTSHNGMIVKSERLTSSHILRQSFEFCKLRSKMVYSLEEVQNDTEVFFQKLITIQKYVIIYLLFFFNYPQQDW